ncbi:MAG: hypothetical protein PHX18_04995 [Candidatus Gastranaerophilales bacterium]|nr:hypothetical protein [Candidatus Gastranaerophilales bacterium]
MQLLTNKTMEKLKYDLVRENVVTYEQLTRAQNAASQNATNIGVELIREKFITEKELLQFIEKKLHIPFVNLNDYEIDKHCLHFIGVEDAQKYKIIPLFKIEEVLTIAMADPLDLFAINQLLKSLDITIEPVLSSQSDIKRAIEKFYRSEEADTPQWQSQIFEENMDDTSFKKVVEGILDSAIKSDAKTVTMETSKNGLSIFFNKDLKGLIPAIFTHRFTNELKSLFNMAQDEEFKAATYHYRGFCFLLSTLQTVNGERLSIKIFPPLKKFIDFSFEIKDLEKLSNIIKDPCLIGIEEEYSNAFALALLEFLSTDKSVLSVEAVVKHRIAAVTQIQSDLNVGLNFEKIVNAIDYQGFEVIYFETLYTNEQIEKLKLLAKEKTVIFSKAYNEKISGLNCNIKIYNSKASVLTD